jgi:heme-degrading monooxygenase HmoA
VIARIWRGWTRRDDADAYVEYLQQTGAPASLGTAGNRGFFILHRPSGEREEFVTISLWDSLEVVKGFAGEDVEQAVFFPEDERFLVEREPTVSHYEWITGTDRAPEA